MGKLRPGVERTSSTEHLCRACAHLVSKPGGSFIQSLAHLFASSTVLPSLQLHAFLAQPCLESLLLLSPRTAVPIQAFANPVGSTFYIPLRCYLLTTDISLVQAWRCICLPSRLPVLTLAPVSCPLAHTARGTCKTPISFFPSSTQSPPPLLPHSKQEPVFPNAYQALHRLALAACGPHPPPLSPGSLRLSHTGLLAACKPHTVLPQGPCTGGSPSPEPSSPRALRGWLPLLWLKVTSSLSTQSRPSRPSWAFSSSPFLINFSP